MALEYYDYYKEYTALDRQIKELESVDKTKQDTVELLSFQVNEIEDAALTAEEEEQLNTEKQLIKNAENIISSITDAYSYLFGDDESMGALSALQEAAGQTAYVSGFSQQLAEISEKLNEAAVIAQDAGFELKNYIDDFDVDISAIDEIEERLDVYYKLKRKYGPEVEDVLEFYENSKAELEKIREQTQNIE